MTDIESLEERRKELDINKSTMSELVGYAGNDGWGRAVRKDSISNGKLETAEWVLEYVSENDIIPEPKEVTYGTR